MAGRAKSKGAKRAPVKRKQELGDLPVWRVLFAMLAANFGLGKILSWIQSGTGIDPTAYFWDTLGKTLPLSIGAAAISLMVGLWLSEAFCDWPVLVLVAALMFGASGYVGTLLTDDMAKFMRAYDPVFEWIPSSGVVMKALLYSVLSVVGFWEVYGAERFIGALVIGTAGPWIAWIWALKHYEKAQKVVAAELDGE